MLFKLYLLALVLHKCQYSKHICFDNNYLYMNMNYDGLFKSEFKYKCLYVKVFAFYTLEYLDRQNI